jgi:hypothetical protein
MHNELKMSMIIDLSFILGLQIKQFKDEIFFSQTKYVKKLLKRFGVDDNKPNKILMTVNATIDFDISKELDIT